MEKATSLEAEGELKYAGLTVKQWGLAISSVLLVCIFFGAVPFLMAPDSQHGLWWMGFAQSYANQSFPAIYANNFGFPQSAPLGTGLSGAVVASILIRIGFYPGNAYALMSALYLAVAFWGAYRMAKLFCPAATASLLLAFLWLSNALIWGHTPHGAVSLGVALLPFCLFAAAAYWSKPKAPPAGTAFLAFACLLEVFMDEHAFVMFACGTLVVAIFTYLKRRREEPAAKNALLTQAAVCVASFLVAYILYYLYAGGLVTPNRGEMGAFRAFGADIGYLIAPTKGVYAFFDLFGLGANRTVARLFGDPSVWSTAFLLPALIVAVWAAFGKHKFRLPLLIIAVFALYMSFGPGLKLFLAKPAGVANGELVPDTVSLFPTGSSLVSMLPIFRDLYAAHRWLALAWFGMWGLIALGLYRLKPKFAYAALIVLIALNLPSWRWLKGKFDNRAVFTNVDTTLTESLGRVCFPGDRVLFVPYRNDHLLNYVAARCDLRAYNTGGEANLRLATKHWPFEMRNLVAREQFLTIETCMALLETGLVDSVVFPYFHSDSYALCFPCAGVMPGMKRLAALKIKAFDENQYYMATDMEWFGVTQIRPSKKQELAERIGKESHKPGEEWDINFAKISQFDKLEEISGLSELASWGRWSDAALGSSVQLKLKKPMEKRVRLKISMQAIQPQKVTVTVGGESRTVEVEKSPKIYPFEFDLEQPTAFIDILPEKPMPPGPGGTRFLGVGLRSILIEPPDEEASSF